MDGLGRIVAVKEMLRVRNTCKHTCYALGFFGVFGLGARTYGGGSSSVRFWVLWSWEEASGRSGVWVFELPFLPKHYQPWRRAWF